MGSGYAHWLTAKIVGTKSCAQFGSFDIHPGILLWFFEVFFGGGGLMVYDVSQRGNEERPFDSYSTG